MLTYTQITRVHLDGKYIGDIKAAPGGWAYFPKGHKDHGEVFKTIDAVAATL